MQNVRLIDITTDFYAFSHNVNNHTEIIISAHGWRNNIIRNGVLIDAFQLGRLINGWGGCSKITLACCSSVYLEPTELSAILVYGDAYLFIYQNTLTCILSYYIRDVSIVGFIG